MKSSENLKEMTPEHLMEINGGGFAYDVGRILRFIGLSGGSGVGTAYALTDWQINALINKEVNG